MKKKILRICLILVGVVCLASAGFLYVIYRQVADDATMRIEKGVIERIIFSESPVYYDDGKTPIGVFFDKTHRKYIRYEDIPKTFIKAIVSAEDKNFFHHPGFDLRAVARAFVANLKAGRTVQGGSTITQQTAKNIFKRERKTYTAKLRELFQAVLLERRYSKEEILEMYSNQFFVSGFGRGLRIAAEYFFNKDAEELDLVEAAFIAGSVKGPSTYTPFTKKTRAAEEKAKRLAKLRKDYVLENMYKLNFISENDYLAAKEREVPFNRGRVTYRLNVILDYIRDQLFSDYFKKILQEQGIDNIATSGIRICTSINREIQEGGLESIRSRLPVLDVMLSGYHGASMQKKDWGDLDGPGSGSSTGLPFPARISQIRKNADDPALIVTWEKGGGIVDFQGLKSIGEAWLKSELGNWAVFDRRHVPEFLKGFKVGDIVPVRVLARPGDGDTRLALSKIPELEGGIVAMRNGMIKAMVGGFYDRFFNRAVDAKRQLGSIFKPIVYAAALQLKWNSLDPLVNVRDLFRFESTLYLPRPDHTPEAERVSLAWAGVRSENLATVWLLYHLTDRLNMSEFRRLVELLGLNKKEGESYEIYTARIRDRYGVMVNEEALMEAAFEQAKEEIRSDLIFGGHEETLDTLGRVHFRVDIQGIKDQGLDPAEEERICRMNFQRLRSLNFEMKRRLGQVLDVLNVPGPGREAAAPVWGLSDALRGFYFAVGEEKGSRLIYSERPDSHEQDLWPLTEAWVLGNSEKLSPSEIWIEGVLPSEVIDIVQARTEECFRRLSERPRYDLEVLSRVKDFKVLVNLLYVIRLAREMGISTDLDPVLSFPLGANAVSILESAVAYQTMVTGHVYPLGDELSAGMVPVITRIEDRDGVVIWEYEPRPRRVLSERVSGLITEILRLVVEHGTGSNAREAVRMSVEIGDERIGFPVPAYGKTGTANRYTNSSYVGIIPGPGDRSEKLCLENGYVIATYVGYDDNRPMKGKRIVIYGSSGALPLWIDTANAVVNSPGYRANLQIADLAFDIQSVFSRPNPGLRPVPVSTTTGFPVRVDPNASALKGIRVFADLEPEGAGFSLKRLFEPITGQRSRS